MNETLTNPTEVIKKKRVRPAKNKTVSLENKPFSIKGKVVVTQEDINKYNNSKENETRTALANLINSQGGKYKTLDYDVYSQSLDAFTLNELQAEALDKGIRAINDRSQITRTLLELFSEYKRSLLPNGGANLAGDNLTNGDRDNLKKIMRDGR